MLRRHFLGIATAVLLPLSVPVVAQESSSPSVWPNGELDLVSGEFLWTNGGGDPLRLSWEKTLKQKRVAEKVPAHVRVELLGRIRVALKGLPTHQVADGDREDVMFSGKKGWMAKNVVAMPSKWPSSRSRDAWAVYYTDPKTGNQWRLTVYKACNNIALTGVAAPLQCVCVPEKGDACSS